MQARIKIGDEKYDGKTLKTILRHFGEQDAHISFLKLDVEGNEILAMPGWADDGETIIRARHPEDFFASVRSTFTS